MFAKAMMNSIAKACIFIATTYLGHDKCFADVADFCFGKLENKCKSHNVLNIVLPVL